MFDLTPRLKRYWLLVRNSIAFVPSVWVVCFIVLAVVLQEMEARGLSDWLGDREDFWIVSDVETARSILSAIIGGVISLTVFSFSMVMIVLSQATNSLSPRLLPQLIRDRSHQNTLGLYLGVIMFSFLMLTAIKPGEDWRLDAFSIFFAVILAITCLFFFVFFIASISKRIQVGEVMKSVHQRAVNDINYWKSGPRNWSLRGMPRDVDHWFPVTVVRSGYVDITLYGELSSLAGRLGTRFHLLHSRGAYVIRGETLFTAERPLTNEELEIVAGATQLEDNREKEFWYLPALRHITEVAVKAMSPGINDPGTASEAVKLITDILVLIPTIPDYNHYHLHENPSGEIYFRTRPFTEVLRTVMEQIRTYASSDPSVMRNLYRGLKSLQVNSTAQPVKDAVKREMEALLEDGVNNISNSYDREQFAALFNE